MTIDIDAPDPFTVMTEMVMAAVRNRTHLVVVSPPGTGKVWHVKNALNEHGCRFWELRALSLDINDIRTMPMIRDGGIKMVPSPVLAMLNGDKPILVEDWLQPPAPVVATFTAAIERGCAPLIMFFYRAEDVPEQFAGLPRWHMAA